MDNSTPLYQEIYDDLLKKIDTGYYSEKTVLPSERALCSLYHVSRATIRRALEELRKNHFIETRQGSGNYVKPQVSLFCWFSESTSYRDHQSTSAL